MRQVRQALSLVAVAVLAGIGGPAQAGQATPQASAVSPQPVVVRPNRYGISPPLRSLPPAVPDTGRREPHPPLPVRRGAQQLAPVADPVVQTSMSPTAPGSVLNFEGIGSLNGVLPPDTNGDIGPNHYVQWVNLSLAVFDLTTGLPPVLTLGPINGNQIWAGFGGPCEATNDGDPIVLYDEAADRWLLSQFALPNFPSGPYYQCIAVSTGWNPAGSYHLYEYEFTKLNDYPKFGVWPDGYYMAINQYRLRGPFFRWAGQGVAAFDRAAMLNGDPADMVYFDMANADQNLGGMLPADLDGAPPPAGSGAYFAQIDDDAWGYSPDQIQIWELDVDWASPTNSTFTKQAEVLTAAFDSNLCGYSRNCIPQPNTNVKLDALSDRLMYRLQYRNRGGQETFVVSHSVDVNANDRAGVRWYEIRKVDNAWTIHQQGTFAPADGNHRWMGTAAMDKAGNIALGYNVSGNGVVPVSPSIRFTTRCATDTLGQMGGEGDLRIGGGQQTHSSSRWGDYSMLAVDPVDGRTFWFTGEYYGLDTQGSAGWRTYIGSFTVDDQSCGAPSNVAPTVTILTPADPTTVDFGVSIDFSGTALDSEDGDLSASLAWTSSIEGPLDTGASITATLGVGTHTVTASVTDSGSLSGSNSITVTVNAVGGNAAPTVIILTPANGTTVDETTVGEGVSIDFSGTATDPEDDDISGSLVWTSNLEGDIGNGAGPFPATLRAGTHTVTASVTDSGSLSGSNSITVTVNGGGSITLSATGRKDRGTKYADLVWSGATGDQVEVYRDNGLVATTDNNDGRYTDTIGRGGGSHTFLICQLDGTCSNPVTLTY